MITRPRASWPGKGRPCEGWRSRARRRRLVHDGPGGPDPVRSLHVHTEYSMLDGAARLKDLFAKVKARA